MRRTDSWRSVLVGSGRTGWTFLLLAVLCAPLVAACGTSEPPPSTAATSASSTSSAGAPPNPSAGPPSATAQAPSASPDASDVDVVAKTLALIGNRSFTARSSVTGTLTVGSASRPIQGTYDLNAVGFSRALTIGRDPEQRFVLVRLQARASTGNQPWFEVAVPNPRIDLAATLAAVGTLTEVGIESKGGRSMHHLTAPDARLAPGAIGVESPTTAVTAGTVELWVADDGTPGWIRTTSKWTHGVGKASVDASMTLDFALSDVGSSIVISVPEPAWFVEISKRYRYSIGRPYNWSYKAGTGPYRDTISTITSVSTGATTLYVYSSSSGGHSLGQWVDSIKRSHPAGVTNFKFGSSKSTKLVGEPARRLEYRQTFRGHKEWDIEIVAIHSHRLYSLDWASVHPFTPDDELRLGQFLSTFAYR